MVKQHSDKDIRDHLKAHFKKYSPGMPVFEEVSIPGVYPRTGVVMDIVCITAAANHIWGIEIKSDKDTLKRLPAQIAAYNRICDACFLITTMKHRYEALKCLPSWWNLLIYDGYLGPQGIQPSLTPSCRHFFERSPAAMLELVWKEDLVREIVSKTGYLKSQLLKHSKGSLAEMAIAIFGLDKIRQLTAEAIIRKKNEAEAREPYDGIRY